MSLRNFSVFNNNISLDSKKSIITKVYSLNEEIGITHYDLKKLMDDYIESMTLSGINIPKTIDSFCDSSSVTYVCKFSGRNIIELGLSIDTFHNYKQHIKKMLQSIHLAMKNQLHFDPHPKNFVFDENNNIYYVDFFPPYTQKLKEKRLAIAEKNERKIISDNYNFFYGDFLPCHFCGDFLNIDQRYEDHFFDIYNEAVNLNIVSKTFDEFITMAKSIRRTEDERLQRKINLL